MLHNFEYMQQPFIALAVHIKRSGAEFREGSSDIVGQRQANGDLLIVILRGGFDQDQFF